MARKMWEDDVSDLDLLGDSAELENEDMAQSILDEYEEEETPVVARRSVKPVSKNPAYVLSSKETDIMQLAMVQLEQAKLYDMFLKHNLFEGVKANAIALKKVEKELKEFILERMQILLGMKEEKRPLQTPQSFRVELPFNEVEIDFIKALAFKGTKGESAHSTVKSVDALPSMKPMSERNLTKLQPVSENKMKSMMQNEEYEQEEEEEEYEVPVRKVAKPIQRQARPSQKTVSSKPTTIEELAMEDLKKMAKRKNAYEMTDSELMEANKKIRNNKSGKPSGGIPMPSSDQMVGHYMSRQVSNQANSGQDNALMSLLSNKLGFSTNSVQQVGDEE